MAAVSDVSFLQFTQASIAGDDALAVSVLKNFKKDAPSIAQDCLRIHTQISEIEAQLSAIRPWARAVITSQLNKRDTQNQLPIEKAIASHKTEEVFTHIVLGADCRLKTKDGTSLLHLALTKGQVDTVHKLLIEGLDPNERDKDGKSLLYIAAEMADMRAAYLLLAYGATCSEVEAGLLISLAKTYDPLYISNSDTVLFATALAHLLVQECAGYSNLAALVDLLGGSWLLYNQLPAIKRPSHRAVVVLGLIGAHMLPVTHTVMQFAKSAFATLSAFAGIKAVYNNYSKDPLAAIKKGVVHTVNTLFSWSMFQRSAAHEYAESELIKSLYHCRNVTVDDIATLDAIPTHERMAWVIDKAHTLDCAPILERIFPGWTCQTFKLEFRSATLVHHPDKTAGNTSSIQTVLNAVNSFWKRRC